MMDFMYGITGRSCMKSNSDSLNKSVDKSFYDSRGFFAVLKLLSCLFVYAQLQSFKYPLIGVLFVWIVAAKRDLT